MRPPRFLHPILSRPSFLAAFATLVVVLIVTPWDWRWSTRAIAGWDLAMVVFMVMVLRLMGQTVDADVMAQRARRLDEGRGAVLIISVLGAAAAIAAVVAEIVANKVDKGAFQWARIVVMIATVALSWLFVHTVFALHYAHDYYMPAKPPERIDNVTDNFPADETPYKRAPLPYRAGLWFPGHDRSPDYWDFLHFSIVIGAASQTADINIESKAIRRLVTGHVILSFVFNAVILGLTINLSASLF
ncbi:MAG TPA: DUF1345 domain-containing protein [Caulobacteraceae bacterium]|jgi:uncharacterized membrane protein